MSDELDNCVEGPSLEGAQPILDGSSGGSGGSSPDMTKRILEHSLESLTVSDSSEEGIMILPRGDSAEQLLACQDEPGSETAVGENKATREAEDVGEDQKSAKPKKRRISSRRERKIGLSSTDRVVREIAGVQVNPDL